MELVLFIIACVLFAVAAWLNNNRLGWLAAAIFTLTFFVERL